MVNRIRVMAAGAAALTVGTGLGLTGLAGTAGAEPVTAPPTASATFPQIPHVTTPAPTHLTQPTPLRIDPRGVITLPPAATTGAPSTPLRTPTVVPPQATITAPATVVPRSVIGVPPSAEPTRPVVTVPAGTPASAGPATVTTGTVAAGNAHPAPPQPPSPQPPRPPIPGTVVIHDRVTGVVVVGVTYWIRGCASDVVVARVTSGRDGVAATALAAGCYRLVQVDGPPGYRVDPVPVYINVNQTTITQTSVQNNFTVNTYVGSAAQTTVVRDVADRTPITAVPTGPVEAA